MQTRYADPRVSTKPIATASRQWDILTDIPYVRIISAGVIAFVCLIGLIRSLTIGTAEPMLLPLLASIISAVALMLIDFKERYGTTYMRIGFHAGILVFLCGYPILAPEVIRAFDLNVRFTAGMALVLCVIGFEVGYWSLRTLTGIPSRKSPFILVANNYAWTNRLLFVGISLYALFTIYIIASSGRSFYSLFFLLRGVMSVNQDEVLIASDENRNQIATLFSYGRYMAAAAATILILAPNPFHFSVSKTIAWIALGLNAFIGLNQGSGGSRSTFLLSAVPLLTTAWIYAGTYRSIRPLRPMVAGFLLFIAYFGVQYLSGSRDQGVIQGENVGFTLERVDLSETKAFSAFLIYQDYEKVISGFPDKAAFQNGASIIPIVIGWIPRRFWPDKPYPFSNIANAIVGFDVKVVSIASGLPAEGYGNFGLAGTMLWGALMGLACAFADFRLSNLRPSHPLALAMRGMMAVWAAILVRGGTAEMFYMGVFPIGFMWICLYFSEPRFRKPN